jgi:hypothetical protein
MNNEIEVIWWFFRADPVQDHDTGGVKQPWPELSDNATYRPLRGKAMAGTLGLRIIGTSDFPKTS